MNKFLRQWAVIVMFAVAGMLISAPAASAQQADASQQELASVEQLKLEAFKALKGGQFDRTSELLTRAASLSKDPCLAQMSEWIQQFQSQRHEFVAERHKGYEKAVADVQKLLKTEMSDYAVDSLKNAYLLSDDKDAFSKEPWVAELLTKAKASAADYEAHEQWVKAQRLYSHLSAMEPANPLWKEKVKLVTQRLRLLAMYTPDEFKRVIDDEVKQREAAEQLVNPTTQPTTKPADREENDSFRTDWHDMLHGIRMDMLVDALDDARGNYWREVSYKTLTTGGLKGLQALASTKGLEKAFANLGDPAKREAFLGAISQGLDQISKATAGDEGRVMRRIIDSIMTANQNSVQLPEQVLVNEFADGAFGELDPFSTMIWPSDLEEFNKSTQGEFSGVGIQIISDEEGNLKVVSPLEDSPAYKQGIHAGDLIIRINGKNAKGITTNQAVKNITGPANTYVTLTIKSPNGTVKDYTIRRETIHVASIKGYQHLTGGGWDYFVDPNQKIAYMRMTNFSKSTEDELRRAISEMEQQGAKAVILDLRNNPGGLLTAATEVCDTFLSHGVIVSTRGEREVPGQPPVEAKASPDDVTLPVVVLVNQFSASASEIVSGALQDQKRAIVVGERTFGKGSVQMLFPLAGRSAALKLTTSHYYLPSGRCIHKEDNSTTWGVDPDLTVEMTSEQMRAAQETRQELEVLRENGEPSATAPTTVPAKKDLLAADPQLSAAVLLLRLQLAGATL